MPPGAPAIAMRIGEDRVTERGRDGSGKIA
jgi:hypothetical protein